MVARGEPLANILAAGEWHSSALHNYMNESEVDRLKYVATLLEQEENDEH